MPFFGGIWKAYFGGWFCCDLWLNTHFLISDKSVELSRVGCIWYLKAGDVLMTCALQVVIPEAETRAGLALKPKVFPVTVTDRPVMDVTFSQFLASVSGKISCLGKAVLKVKWKWRTSALRV